MGEAMHVWQTKTVLKNKVLIKEKEFKKKDSPFQNLNKTRSEFLASPNSTYPHGSESQFSFLFTPPLVLSTEQAPALPPTLALSVIQEIAEGLPRWCSGKESACQCRRLQRRGFDAWVRKIPWSRKWQPAPIFLPGKDHVQRSLVGYCPWGCKELGTTKHTHTHTHTHTIIS